MSYTYITNRNAPAYTPASQVAGNWGIGPRTIEGITIHHWGDPNQNPQFAGIVDYLCRSGANTSAHFVATGTNRQVACIVDPSDAAWHAGSAWGNVHTIGIELDPRARDIDYDVAAELVADIRSAYGDVPIYWHSYFSATACPGAWSPERLDKLSYTKYSAAEWGKGGNKVTAPTPVPAPAPTPVAVPVAPTVTKLTNFLPTKTFKIITPTTLVNIPANTKYATSKDYAVGEVIADVVELVEWSDGTRFYRTKYARDTAKKLYGFGASKLTEVVPVVPAPIVLVPSPTTQQPDGTPLADTGVAITDKDDYLVALKENTSLLQKLIELLKSIFKIG